MAINAAAPLDYKFPPTYHEYDARDLIIYALGVGAARDDPLADDQLKFTYERHPSFAALPTFGVLPAFGGLIQAGKAMKAAGFKFNPMAMLHGEEYLELHGPLPTACKLRCENKMSGLYDKVKAVVADLECNWCVCACNIYIYARPWALPD